jgi:hypothetical protein
MLAQCPECDSQVLVPHSCGHRHCPHCQHHEGQQWLERQLHKQVPAEYFLLTFTLPQELRPLAWQHQRMLYALMILCSWESVRVFSENDKQLQGTPGAIEGEKKRWRTKGGRKARRKGQSGYLFNHQALAKVFRAKLLEAIGQEGLELPASYPESWVVDVKSVGTGEKALVYLGRYLYKGVLQERDIIACENGQVTFRYLDSKTKQFEFRTVSGVRFLWLILQHVLPKGFRRARNFGFLHPNSKRLMALLQYLLGFDPKRALAWVKHRPPLTCRCCGAVMRIVRTRICPVLPVPVP